MTGPIWEVAAVDRVARQSVKYIYNFQYDIVYCFLYTSLL